jgi:rubrerythrin
VTDTRQNLVATLAHENAERSGAYPRLARQARADGAPAAALSFTLAHAAETGLVRLYQDALANLDRLHAPGEPLHVCGTCGHVERAAAPERCPVCLSARASFAQVE